MSVHNTGFDAANTIVRAFLTRVGEEYLGHPFNTGSGRAKEIWDRIKTETFNSQCAYCGDHTEKLTMEHLIMMNREQCGLHHPGNTVPCCRSCNSSQRKKDPHTKKYIQWDDHLERFCSNLDELKIRKKVIKNHIQKEEYPSLTEDEFNALRAVAEDLYQRTATELENSLELFKKIDTTLVRSR